MSTEDRPRTKAAQSEATRRRLVGAGRELFGAQGYAGVPTEELVRHAGVTRGALYHQFADKRDLFRAVVEELEGELITTAAAAMAGETDLLAGLRAGCRGWLDACSAPAAQRILLLDAPGVLGWETWREIGARHGLGVVAAALEAGMAGGVLAPRPVRPLAHVLVAALDEAALYVARAEDPAIARAETEEVIDGLIDALAA